MIGFLLPSPASRRGVGGEVMNFLKYFTKYIKGPIVVATHNGSFHADDVFACATLSIWAEKYGRRIKIIRTRDPEIINKADIVVDVGGQYIPEKNRFDHHQREGAGLRENGIPYSSFGLVWKHYASKICRPEVAKDIERRLVWPLDARDNGMNIYNQIREDLDEYAIRNAVVSFRPRTERGDWNFDGQFMKAVKLAKMIILAEIQNTDELVTEESKVEAEIISQNEPEILILNEHLFWDRVASRYKNIKMVVCPKPQNNTWAAETPRDDLNNYDSSRAKFPHAWAGLRDKELEDISGIQGAIFCHRGRFLVVTKTKDAALAMAKKALVDYNTGN